MLGKENNTDNRHLIYKILQWKKQGSFYALNDISDRVKLLQLTNSIASVNHTVVICGKWIFDSNFKIYLPLSV